MLRNAGGRQIKRGGKAGHVFFAVAQIFDQAQAIRMGEQFEQFCKLARYEKPTWHASPQKLQDFADLHL